MLFKLPDNQRLKIDFKLNRSMPMYHFCLPFNMLQAGVILVFLLIKKISSEDHSIDLVDVNALTTLPLDTLLNIKRNIVSLDENVTAQGNFMQEDT